MLDVKEVFICPTGNEVNFANIQQPEDIETGNALNNSASDIKFTIYDEKRMIRETGMSYSYPEGKILVGRWMYRYKNGSKYKVFMACAEAEVNPEIKDLQYRHSFYNQYPGYDKSNTIVRVLGIEKKPVKVKEVTMKKKVDREYQREETEKFNNSYQPLAEGISRSLDCYKTLKNNNIIIIGPPGSNKSRGIIIPTILQGVGSMIISDPKGSLSKKYGKFLKKKGYNVKVISLTDPQNSMHYNPMSMDMIKNSSDIKKLAYTIVYTKPGKIDYSSSNADPFWDQTSVSLLSAVIGYIFESDRFSDSQKNLNSVIQVVSSIQIGEDDISDSEFAFDMKEHEQIMKSKGLESFAYREFKKVLQTPHKTICTILTTVQAALASFDTTEIMNMTSINDIDVEEIANEKTALFIVVSDTDRSLDSLASIFYSQLLNGLCKYADSCEDQRLPIPLRVILDDFATNVRIPNFDNILSNIRSRAISAILVCQSESQLFEQYRYAAETIMDDCDTHIYMGANSLSTAENISRRANIPVYKAASMPIGTCYIFEHGEPAKFAKSINLDKYLKENSIVIERD